jgi:hypothetical protein
MAKKESTLFAAGMSMKIISIALLLFLVTLAGAEKKKTAPAVDPLIGTWRTTDDGMVLRFAKGDTLCVTSTSDSSMGGCGKYTHTDTTFFATLKNGDMVMKMAYLYRWKGRDTVEAKATLFTIDNEAVEYPTEWMAMARSGGKKGAAGGQKGKVGK